MLDGDICSKKRYRKRLTPIKGKIFLFCRDRTNSPPSGASPLHQFWSYSFLSFLFRHAWDTAQPCTGRVLTGVQMGCRQGRLWRVKEQKDLFTWGSHLYSFPYGLACALAWCHLTHFAELGCWGLAELAAWAQSQFVWLVWLCTAFLAGWAVICVSCQNQTIGMDNSQTRHLHELIPHCSGLKLFY